MKLYLMVASESGKKWLQWILKEHYNIIKIGQIYQVLKKKYIVTLYLFQLVKLTLYLFKCYKLEQYAILIYIWVNCF